MIERLRKDFEESAQVLREFGRDRLPELVGVIEATAGSLSTGGKVLVFGNGGSAADAQHLAAEFVNRFRIERVPLPAIALTTDSSILTSIGNDYGFEQVFEKQLQALARPGDVAIGISTSGGSPNVLRGLAAARGVGCVCVGLCGVRRDAVEPLCDHVLSVPHPVTARVQECHIAILHALCDGVDTLLFPGVGA